jgi:endogenous inhibitor of DNA gyrase (YacG/DUF329 family)
VSRGGSHPCEVGCTCTRHPGGSRPKAICPVCGREFEFQRSLIGKRRFCSPECHLIDYNASTERWESKSQSIKEGHARKTPEAKILHGKRISEARKGMQFSDAHKAAIAAIAVSNWTGGTEGDTYAAILCPHGFVREYHFLYGEHVISTAFGLRRRSFNLDFAHVEGKINIELDGPSHKTTFEKDTLRDAILRDNGWRVIRIKHA